MCVCYIMTQFVLSLLLVYTAATAAAPGGALM